MLDRGAGIAGLDVGEGVRAAVAAHEEGVALREIAGTMRARQYFHEAAVAVLPMTGRDAFRNDGALRVGADVDHLRAGVGLLVVVGNRDRIERTHRVLAAQDAGGIFPGDRRAGFHLRPRDPGIAAAAFAALGYEVVDAADAVLITRVPVLHGRVLDLRVILGDELHYRRVQLVFIAHGRGAALEVTHVRTRRRDDQRALELTGVLGVDAEVGGQLHGAAYAGRYVHKRAVGEDRGVERGEEVVALRHDTTEILLDERRVILHGFRE